MAEYEFTGDSLFPVQIDTENLRLRLTSPSEITPKQWYEFYKRECIREATQYVHFGPYDTIHEAHEHLHEKQDDWQNGEKAEYYITLPDEQTEYPLIGTASIFPNWEQQTAVFGMFLDKEYWGNGYSSERGAAFLELCFEHFGIKSVSVGAAEENTNSQKAIEKYVVANGGQKDGVVRDMLCIDGELHNMVRYTIRKTEWDA